jgi:hypothetical protein
VLHFGQNLIIFAFMTAMIEKHIAHLLHYHDCVIVPGLGGFVANFKSAMIHPEQNLFVPPLKEIGFNRSLLHQDGLLANHLAVEQSLSFAEASTLLSTYVKEVRSSIAAGEIVDIGEVGSLRGDAIGNIIFLPNESASFLPDALGLNTFRFEPLGYKHVAKIEQKMHVPQMMQNRSPRYWTSVAAMVAGLFFFSTIELKMPEVSEAGFSSILVPSTEHVAVEVIKTEPLATESVFADESLVPVSEISVAPKKHHIIAASFRQSAPANQSVRRFIQEGYSQAQVLADGAGRFRIALESFENRQNAIDAMQKYRQEKRFAEVWVHSTK